MKFLLALLLVLFTSSLYAADLTTLTGTTTVEDGDIIYLLNDPSGSKNDRKISVGDFRGGILDDGTTAVYNSEYNFSTTPTVVGINAGTQYSIDGSSLAANATNVLFSLYGGHGTITNTMNHVIPIIGWADPDSGDNKTGYYGGVEGRCNADDAGHTCYGVIGRAELSDVSGTNTGSTVIAADFRVEDDGNHTTGGLAIGLNVDINGIDPSTLLAGVLVDMGNYNYNYGYRLKGIINSNDVDATMIFEDTVLDAYWMNFSDTHITNGVVMQLSDAAGTAEFTVSDNAFADAFVVDSDGNAVFAGPVQAGKVAADPCSGQPEGAMFYNDTSNYYCYCDGTNDVQLHNPAVACF